MTAPRWFLAGSSRRSHAIRDHSPKVGAPGVRMSMCGRVAWHRTAEEAPAEMLRCIACTRALEQRATV